MCFRVYFEYMQAYMYLPQSFMRTYGTQGDPYMARWPGCHYTYWGNCCFLSTFFFILFALSHIFLKIFFLDVIFPSPFLSPEFDVISF